MKTPRKPQRGLWPQPNEASHEPDPLETNLWRMTQRGKTAMAMVSKLRYSNLSDLKIAA
jgi:hypothetical protein